MRLTPKIQKAINVSAEAHLGQTRKGTALPYIVHPFSVAYLVSEFTVDEDIIVACLLHDVLEDVDPKRYIKSDMLRDFGVKITSIVEEVTERKVGIKSKAKLQKTWQERKDKYIEGLKTHSEEGLMVCCADKINNLESLITDFGFLGDLLWDRFNAPEPKKEKIIWFYTEILKVLEKRLKNDIVSLYKDTLAKALVVFGD